MACLFCGSELTLTPNTHTHINAMNTTNEVGRSVTIIRTPHVAPAGDYKEARWMRQENEHEEKMMRRSLNAFIDRFPCPVAYTVDGRWEKVTIDGAFATQAEADRFAARAGKIVKRWAANGFNVAVQP